MKVKIFLNSEDIGQAVADYCTVVIKRCITQKGEARILLSTGVSQFDTIKGLLEKEIEWEKVEMFHLDEYISLPESHPASFRKYLKERFTSKINLKAAHFVNGEGNVEQNIYNLNNKIRELPIDLGLVGIGENAHIAFNDPPADFEVEDPYIIVNLNEECKKQQVREGWFPTVDDVPKQAISMSVKQILKCNEIVSCVPYKVKAIAVKNMLENSVSNMIPATILKTHPKSMLFLDVDSASLTDKEIMNRYL